MDSFAHKIRIGVKAVRQLGWRYTWLYASYRLQLRAGILRWRTPVGADYAKGVTAVNLSLPVFQLPERETIVGVLGEAEKKIMLEADEIIEGKIRLFGGEPQSLNLVPSGKLGHWSKHTGYQHAGVDIKFIWEPGRFGWATVLARAFHLTKDEKYARKFWELTEKFIEFSPTNIGPHWVSAQEVGLRLISLVFAAGVFKDSTESNPTRMGKLAAVLASHAARIPSTLGYSRAQNNNHLLTEAAALYTAAVVLPKHPKADQWRKLGWRLLHSGLDRQITTDGDYAQHSVNYHRLMLQTSLWVHRLAVESGDLFPTRSITKLASASLWLSSLLDIDSGHAPNLGSNDGAYILPLTVCEYSDFRPVLQAAGRAFLGEDLFPAGQWDEMSVWLVPDLGEPSEIEINPPLRLQSEHSWAYLRTARYLTRPSHADQLHLDLWWRGINLALDGGTYQYNADPPWRNGLDLSSLHNTLTVNGMEQMNKVGQFLWLDWAQAEEIGVNRDEHSRVIWAAGQHDGYCKVGVCHQREVSWEGTRWMIRDDVLPTDETRQSDRVFQLRVHWLLRDANWNLEGADLHLTYPQGKVRLVVSNPDGSLKVSLARGGKTLVGEEQVEPTRGWVSPTYGVKQPALSFAVSVEVKLPTTFTTIWQLPD
jgi:hypothetical protein